MLHPDHIFLKCFFDRPLDRLNLAALEEDLAASGMHAVPDHNEIAAFEAAVSVANALETELEDWSADTPTINRVDGNRLSELFDELAAENGLKGRIGYALDGDETNFRLFTRHDGQDVFCVLDDGKSWQAFMFFAQPLTADIATQATAAGGDVEIVRSDCINYVHAFHGPREKPVHYEDMAQSANARPKRLESSWSYLDFHTVPEGWPSRDAPLSAYIFADQYFGPTREMPQ
ncbi:MAG: hypothetical protein AAF214_02345 [Pseudomonadota bacterium]